MMFLNEVHNANSKGRGKGGVTQERKKGMNPQPVTLEHRAEGFYLPGQDGRGEHEHEYHRHGEGTEEVNPVTVFKEKEDEHNAPCKERRCFMETCNGKMSGNCISGNDGR